ncbi:MAG: hypothetical protein MUF04_12165, partial [Akkermansiaceae bacterium]|nr:hypothetical protein [Akkermansiaceae bacterium]
MKLRSFWLVIPVALVAFWGCEKKQSPATSPPANAEVSAPAAPAAPGQTPDAPAAPAQPAAPAAAPGAATQTVATAAPPATPEQRAAALGFVRYLPADTEAVIAVHNGGKIAERAQEFKLFKLLQENIGAMFGAGPGMMGEPREFDMEGEGMDGEDFAIPEEDSDEGDTKEAPSDEGAALPRARHGQEVMLVTADGPDPGSEEADAAAAGADEEDAEPGDMPADEDELGMGEMPEMASITDILDK